MVDKKTRNKRMKQKKINFFSIFSTHFCLQNTKWLQKMVVPIFTCDIVELAFKKHGLRRLCCLPAFQCEHAMRALSMQDHEVVIAYTLIRLISNPDANDWLGCCILACKIHSEDDIFVYNAFTEHLKTDARNMRFQEERILKMLDWRIPININVYTQSYLELLAHVSYSNRCTS